MTGCLLPLRSSGCRAPGSVGLSRSIRIYPSWIPGFPQTENRFTLICLQVADRTPPTLQLKGAVRYEVVDSAGNEAPPVTRTVEVTDRPC